MTTNKQIVSASAFVITVAWGALASAQMTQAQCDDQVFQMKCQQIGDGPFDQSADLDTWASCRECDCLNARTATRANCQKCTKAFKGSSNNCGNSDPNGGPGGSFGKCELNGSNKVCNIPQTDGPARVYVEDVAPNSRKIVTWCNHQACDILLAGVGNPPQSNTPAGGTCQVTQSPANSNMGYDTELACVDAGDNATGTDAYCQPIRDAVGQFCGDQSIPAGRAGMRCGGARVVAHSWGTVGPAKCNIPIKYAGGLCAQNNVGCYMVNGGGPHTVMGHPIITDHDPVPSALQKCCRGGAVNAARRGVAPGCANVGGTYASLPGCLKVHLFNACYAQATFGNMGAEHKDCGEASASFTPFMMP